MSNPRALVLTGDGINCEEETAFALDKAGFKTNILHINQLLENKNKLKDYQTLALPGGFSFGDELASGKILALKINHGLKQEFHDFLEKDKLIIGICNGFQALCWLNLFKDSNDTPIRLMRNNHKKFLNRWVKLNKNGNSNSKWLSAVDNEIHLPIRHGEGRIQINSDQKHKEYKTLDKKGMLAFEYNEDVNGADFNIAALSNERGNVLGLMPHPEAAINQLLNPFKDKQNKDDDGLSLFKSGYKYFQ